MKRSVANILPAAARLVLVAVALGLLYLGLAKAEAPSDLAFAIAAHGLLPASAARQAAVVVIALELAVGLSAACAVLAGCVPLAAALLAGLLGLFAVYLCVLALNPPATPAPCGCGISRANVTNWWVIAGFDAAAALAVLACGVIGSPPRPSLPTVVAGGAPLSAGSTA